MLTQIEVCKLAREELLRQRKEEQVKYIRKGEVIVTDRLKKLDKDISSICHMIAILERAEANKLKYQNSTITTTHKI